MTDPEQWVRAVQKAARMERLAENRLMEWKRAERACDRMQGERDDVLDEMQRVLADLRKVETERDIALAKVDLAEAHGVFVTLSSNVVTLVTDGADQ